MKEFIEFIAKQLVDKPEEVNVEEIPESGNVTRYILHVSDGDIGKVIGRMGRTAKSIRTLLSAVASKQGLRVMMEIPDKKKKET